MERGTVALPFAVLIIGKARTAGAPGFGAIALNGMPLILRDILLVRLLI
jgi:hypothetical protein